MLDGNNSQKKLGKNTYTRVRKVLVHKDDTAG
jgi:hypothetical protein